MSNQNSTGGELVKTPYTKTHYKNQKEIDDFVKCCDPDNGYLYFMDNFFYIQHPTQGSIQYHPYEYQCFLQPQEHVLSQQNHPHPVVFQLQ